MRAANLRFHSAASERVPDEGSRENCRIAIERFLDRSWVLDGTPLQTLDDHRFALNVLDEWLQFNRAVTLSTASASDVWALLNSTYWEAVARRCEPLMSLVTRFYRSLQDCKVRPDDPIGTVVSQELAAAVIARDAAQPIRRVKPGRMPHFSGWPIV
jgi:site-specific recombinase XerD